MHANTIAGLVLHTEQAVEASSHSGPHAGDMFGAEAQLVGYTVTEGVVMEIIHLDDSSLPTLNYH